ncbi:MAG: hypothetical protein M3N98_08650, partial [Actinomycetota bacterium]|nr:hypothetical protein [Actinomycetota bacterium]
MTTPRKVPAAVRRIAVPALIALSALAWSAGTAAATGSPIRPHRSFVGAINGLTSTSTISVTGCSASGGDGRALVGQTAEVLPLATTAAAAGFTGRAHQISVDLDIPSSDPMLPLIRVVHVGTLHSYQTPTFIPIFVPLPCSGTATAVFTPVKGGPAAVPAQVQVTFVSPQIMASRPAVIAGTTIQ